MSEFSFDMETLIRLCRRNDVTVIGLFGSAARGEATEGSDIDMLVKFGKPKSLLSVVKLERELSESLGRKVEILTEAAISPYLRDSIMRDLTIIYE